MEEKFGPIGDRAKDAVQYSMDYSRLSKNQTLINNFVQLIQIHVNHWTPTCALFHSFRFHG